MKKKTIKNVIFTFFSQVIYIICGFILPQTFIRTYGSDTYGLMVSITQFLAYITLLESGVGLVSKSALYKALANKDRKEIGSIMHYTQKFFNKCALVFVAYIIVLCFIYPTFESAKMFDNIFVISMIIIISISIFSEYFIGITYKLYLQSDQKTYVVSIIQIITYILNTIMVLILVNLNFEVRIVKFLSSLTFVVRPLIQWLYIKYKLKINFDSYDKNYKLKGQINGLSQHIAGVINNNIDTVLLTLFTPISTVSVYSVYNLVVGNLKTLINSFSYGTDALFGDLYARNEKTKLKKYFGIYESLYIIVVTIIFGCCIILIVPFVKLYTSKVNDANYIQIIFSFIFVISGLCNMLKAPYNSLALDAGKFKETKNGAWIEATINIVVSLIMVRKFGLTGVIFGTLLAITYRGLNFMFYSNKNILERNNFISLKKVITSIIEVIIIWICCNKLLLIKINSYLDWLIYSIISFIIISVITIAVYALSNIKETKEITKLLKERKTIIKK